MRKGYALIIGINKVDSKHYSGWDGSLSQPEADALLIKNRADEYSFESHLLKTKDATRRNVISGIKKMALKAESGDLVFIYYSGHGGQIPDRKPRDESDGLDETWCLYDGQLIDDELYRFWSSFKEGVRIFVVSDSCHSGTISKSMSRSINISSKSELVSKKMPDHLIDKVSDENIDFYTEIYTQLAASPKEEMMVSVISYGGCQDNQFSYAYSDSEYSIFTSYFIKTLNNPSINSAEHRVEGGYSYDEGIEYVRKAVHEKMGNMQTPSMNEIGSISFRDQILLQI